MGGEDDSHDPGFPEGVSNSPSDGQRAKRGAEGLFRSWRVVLAPGCADRLAGCESRLPHLPAGVTLGRSRNSSLPPGGVTLPQSQEWDSPWRQVPTQRAEGRDSGAHRKHSAVSSAVIFMVMQMMPLKWLHGQLAGKRLHSRREWAA